MIIITIIIIVIIIILMIIGKPKIMSAGQAHHTAVQFPPVTLSLATLLTQVIRHTVGVYRFVVRVHSAEIT